MNDNEYEKLVQRLEKLENENQELRQELRSLKGQTAFVAGELSERVRNLETKNASRSTYPNARVSPPVHRRPSEFLELRPPWLGR